MEVVKVKGLYRNSEGLQSAVKALQVSIVLFKVILRWGVLLSRVLPGRVWGFAG